ncbi:hypothetical protein Tco_1174616 [Tanacetum coccineum]
MIASKSSRARILKTVCLRWVPTGKTFASSTTKVESETPNGSNVDIPNQCESKQALNVNAGLVLHQMMSDHNSSDLAPQRQEMSVENVSSGLVPQGQKAHDYRWTRDHPLEQVRGNPTMPVQTRRQLATDPEMCMFALTVSIVEPKNIKEAMADSAWIEAMQDELH